jgi:hypothetical protein
VKPELPQVDDPFDYSECLELVAYEVMAQRAAILKHLEGSAGGRPEFGIELAQADRVVSLSKSLVEETTRLVEILRRLDAVAYRLQRHDRTSAS